MKNLLIIIMIIFSIPSFICAGEIDDRLSSDMPAKVKESARQVISLGIENQDIIQMTRTMLENKYTEQQMLAAHDVLIRTKRENLPVDPIINKFYESVAKRSQAEQTVQAMEIVRSRYKTASDFAGEITQDKEQAQTIAQVIAECMIAGIGNGDMHRITELLRQRTMDMNIEEAQVFNKGTLSAVGLMARSGADSGSITEIVSNAFQRGYTVVDMEKLGSAFMKETKDPSSASMLAESYARAIKNGVPADDIGNYKAGGSRNWSGRKSPGAGTHHN